MEPLIKKMLAGDVSIAQEDQKLVEFIVKRRAANQHKHEAPPTARIRTLLGGSRDDLVD